MYEKFPGTPPSYILRGGGLHIYNTVIILYIYNIYIYIYNIYIIYIYIINKYIYISYTVILYHLIS